MADSFRFFEPAEIGDIVSTLLQDREGNLWVAGSFGILTRSTNGKLRRFGSADGLPDNFVRSLWEDRDGNLWAGTDGGLARLERGRFVSSPLASSHEREWVRCIYEDTEGNLWVGMSTGLKSAAQRSVQHVRRNGGSAERLSTTVFQDHRGQIWIGFHDRGLVQLKRTESRRAFTRRRTAYLATRFSPFARIARAIY